MYDFSVDLNIPESIVESRFSLIFDNTTLGTDENVFGENFSLYPNPTPDGSFVIQLTNVSGKVQVEIFNLLGQQVDVEAKDLSKGVYLVTLS